MFGNLYEGASIKYVRPEGMGKGYRGIGTKAYVRSGESSLLKIKFYLFRLHNRKLLTSFKLTIAIDGFEADPVSDSNVM